MNVYRLGIGLLNIDKCIFFVALWGYFGVKSLRSRVFFIYF